MAAGIGSMMFAGIGSMMFAGIGSMHEFALCQALLSAVERVAREHRAVAVTMIRLKVGPLSGAEPALLQRAFEVARLGTIATDAVLDILASPARIRCRTCHNEAEVAPNRLACPACGGGDVALLQGEEMILERVELDLGGDNDASGEQQRMPPAVGGRLGAATTAAAAG